MHVWQSAGNCAAFLAPLALRVLVCEMGISGSCSKYLVAWDLAGLVLGKRGLLLLKGVLPE